MGDKSRIEWTDATWNPVTGCSKVSQGCKNCYAERVFPRAYGQNLVSTTAGPGTPIETRPRRFTDVWTHEDRLDQPLRWKKPRRIFVNSMSDLFHEDVPNTFILDVFDIMERAHWHTFQILTKRPERAIDVLGGTSGAGLNSPPLPNVWLGVSVEDQPTADERIRLLLLLPAAVHWISAEPLLGSIDVTRYLPAKWADELFPAPLNDSSLDGPLLDWVVAGGESGPNARPTHPDWIRSLRDQCAAAGVPFFFKQWGEYHPALAHNHVHMGCKKAPPAIHIDGQVEYRPTEAFAKLIEPGWVGMCQVGKKAAGNTLDGRKHEEYPR